MRVQLSDPTLTDDLRSYLARTACVVRLVADGSLDVEVPEAGDPHSARRELELYLATWCVMHDGVRVSVEL